MTGKARADIGFDDALEGLDLSDWTPGAKTANDRPPKEATEKVAKAAGFKSREPKPQPEAQTDTKAEPAQPQGRGESPRANNRYRTGRNAQLSIKATPETVDAFNEICARQKWQQGLALEYGVELLREAIAAGKFSRR